MLFLLAAFFDMCLVPCCLPRKQRVQANDTRLSNEIRFMHLQKGILRTHFTIMKLPFREKFPCRRNSDSEQTQTNQKRHQTKKKAAYSLRSARKLSFKVPLMSLGFQASACTNLVLAWPSIIRVPHVPSWGVGCKGGNKYFEGDCKIFIFQDVPWCFKISKIGGYWFSKMH